MVMGDPKIDLSAEDFTEHARRAPPPSAEYLQNIATMSPYMPRFQSLEGGITTIVRVPFNDRVESVFVESPQCDMCPTAAHPVVLHAIGVVVRHERELHGLNE